MPRKANNPIDCRIFVLLGVALSFSACGPGLQGSSEESLRSFLIRFHENPEEVQEEIPPKRSQSGESLETDPKRLSDLTSSEKEQTLNASQYLREWVMERSPRASAPNARGGLGHENVDAFFRQVREENHAAEMIYEEDPFLKNVEELDRAGLREGQSEKTPWSDSYWPKYLGQIAYRYADPSFPRSKGWRSNYLYYRSQPGDLLFFVRNSHSLNRLSPAEKYDLLLDDARWGLTEWMWRDGERIMNHFDRVAHWMGICHGWAAAAHYFVPEPEQKVMARSANARTQIPFYPSDIKALVSQLWADTTERLRPHTRFIGYRCEENRPPRDRRGRITDHACWDLNPASWHLILLNHIGKSERSVVMDSSSDAEVWNYPIYSYELEYFNPQTLRPVEHWHQATVEKEDYTIDRFREHRSEQAEYFMGVAMEVKYSASTAPSHRLNPSHRSQAARYVYDLELNENLEVVGGEWYTFANPDFLWSFDPDVQADTEADEELRAEPDWDPRNPLPEHWARVASRPSDEGAPTARVVNALLEASLTPEESEEALPAEEEVSRLIPPEPGSPIAR